MDTLFLIKRHYGWGNVINFFLSTGLLDKSALIAVQSCWFPPLIENNSLPKQAIETEVTKPVVVDKDWFE
jgi:hypothetical protein